MSTLQTEAEKKPEAETPAAVVKETVKAATEAAKPAPKKKGGEILVAVHRIVYGKNQVAPPASFLRASDLTAADLEFLTASGAVREPNEAEALVAEATLTDPIG